MTSYEGNPEACDKSRVCERLCTGSDVGKILKGGYLNYTRSGPGRTAGPATVPDRDAIMELLSGERIFIG